MEELYLCYESLMFKIAFQYTHNRGDAEDIVNDSVVRLLSKLHELREMPEKAHARYIELTVRSVAIDANRGKKREERRQDSNPYNDEQVIHSDDGPYDEGLFRLLSAKELAGKLLLLEPSDRKLLEYKYLMEFTDQEIASLLDIKIQNVRVYILRAKQRLVDLIKKSENENN